MALRTQTAACCLIWFALPLSAQLTYRVRHEHLRKGGTGELRIDERGVAFREVNPTRKRPHVFDWPYGEIQQLTIAPEELRVLTYQDNRWKLGADRMFTFRAGSGRPFLEAYAFLQRRLDQRLVAQLAVAEKEVLWQIPTKHLTRFGGSHGVLIATADLLVYRTDRKGESRTWRFQDTENVSSSGPFQLTVTSFERSRSHYGSRKGFNFQLKEPLSEARYDELWRRLNHAKGLQVLRLNFPKETRR
jgi:hypothetical protein